jgi:hypothetical protein
MLVMLVSLVACSDDDDSADDPLDGIDDATSEQLCNSSLALRDAVHIASQIMDSDALDQAAADYDNLANDARDADADDFAATVEDAADAVRVIADGNRQALGQEERTSTEAEILTSSLRLQLADVKVRLACAERGFTVFGS